MPDNSTPPTPPRKTLRPTAPLSTSETTPPSSSHGHSSTRGYQIPHTAQRTGLSLALVTAIHASIAATQDEEVARDRGGTNAATGNFESFERCVSGTIS